VLHLHVVCQTDLTEAALERLDNNSRVANLYRADLGRPLSQG
jgi:hypothetical protein